MSDMLKDLSNLITARNEALMLWQSVKRLAGPCLIGPPDTLSGPSPLGSTLRTIGKVRFSAYQRANSYCTKFDRPNNWCSNCRQAYDYWNRYLVLAHRVQKLTDD